MSILINLIKKLIIKNIGYIVLILIICGISYHNTKLTKIIVTLNDQIVELKIEVNDYKSKLDKAHSEIEMQNELIKKHQLETDMSVMLADNNIKQFNSKIDDLQAKYNVLRETSLSCEQELKLIHDTQKVVFDEIISSIN